MEIASNYDIAVANLIVAMENNEVSTEQRNAVVEVVGHDLDLMMGALNAIVVAYNAKMYSGAIAAKKAKLYVKSEYNTIGFGEILDYSYLEAAISLFYDRKALRVGQPEDQLKAVKDIYAKNADCPNKRVKDAIASYCLRLLSHFNLVTQDMELTKRIMADINSMSEEDKNAAILPPAIVTEM